jgi:hypothetical protein
VTPEEIELYKDAIKIGVPALVGLLAGLVPYFIERRKVNIQQEIEREKSRKEIIFKFSDALSKYLGSSSAYISYLVSSEHNGGDEWNKKVSKSATEMLEGEIDRIRAKALAGLIGNSDVIDLLLEHDSAIRKVLNLLAHPRRVEIEEKERVLCEMRQCEKSLLLSLGKIL